VVLFDEARRLIQNYNSAVFLGSSLDIEIQPWKKLVIHEVIEYRFGEWVNQIAFNAKSSGGGIPTMQWADGVVFSPANFPATDSVMQEQMDGTLHWSSVSFAIKEKFEKQIVQDSATINLMDVSVNEIFRDLAKKLKEDSKYKE